jgi:hypothetical protein
VTTLQSGKQLSSNDAAAIQNVSNQAVRDLQLLQNLYDEYENNPSTSTIQKIQNAIADLDQNLPALLQAAHISDPVLSGRVTGAVNLISTTVNSFAALIPQTTGTAAAREVKHRAATVLGPADLRKQWNEQVCGTSGETNIDSAQPACEMK